MHAEPLESARRGVSMVETIRQEKLRRVMAEPRVVVGASSSTEAVLAAMKELGSTYAIVVDDGRICGIFTERDHLEKITGSPAKLSRPVAEFMSADPRTLGPDDTLEALFEAIVGGGYRHLPVVEDGRCLGVVSALDIVKYISDLFPGEVYNLPPNVDQVMNRAEGG